jgi:hypothetical protein
MTPNRIVVNGGFETDNIDGYFWTLSTLLRVMSWGASFSLGSVESRLTGDPGAGMIHPGC